MRPSKLISLQRCFDIISNLCSCLRGVCVCAKFRFNLSNNWKMHAFQFGLHVLLHMKQTQTSLAVLLLLVPGTAAAGEQWAGVAGVGPAKEEMPQLQA